MAWRARVGAVTFAIALGVIVVPQALAQDPVAPALPDGVIAPGVRIADVDVSGLTAAAARQAVITQHVAPRRAPVVVVFRGKRVSLSPVAVGYVADVDYAVTAALLFGRSRAVPAEGVVVPLRESVNAKRLRAALESRVAAKYDIPAKDAVFSLRGTKPVVREARPGTELKVAGAVRILRTGLVTRTRNTFNLPSKRVKADITKLPNAIIIDRGNFRLTLWKHRGKAQTYPIAVGTSSHPTPSGNYRVIEKQVNPTWFPPSSPWAAGLGPVAPGPSNPLGTRWIGTSAPAIGMHGTPSPGTIGTRASHGCIRMYIRDVERLYPQVDIGTPVYIR